MLIQLVKSSYSSNFLFSLSLLLFITWSTLSCKSSDTTSSTTSEEIGADASVIDLSVDKQVIRGFGAANIVGWRPDMTNEDIDKAFGTGKGQLGFSILRLRIPPREDQFSMNVPTAKKAHAMGVKIIASPWSPPASIKTNNSTIGGRLRQDMYDEYAAHLKSFADYMAHNGVSLYAISIQNEPDIEVDYESCHWNAEEMVRFLKENAASIGIRIIAPESFQFRRPISDAILNDPAAAANLDIVGGHIYGGGLEPYPLAKEKGKEVWMTEHLDTDISYSAVLATGKEIHDCLTIGNFNAYIWWYIKRFYGPIGDGEEGKAEGEVTKRGYIMSHFSRFIRPGYHRKKADSNPQSDIFVSAYEGDGKLIVVALNMGYSSTEQQFVIKNNDRSITSMAPYVTTSTSNAEQKEPVAVSSGESYFTYEMPAQSIVTFVEE